MRNVVLGFVVAGAAWAQTMTEYGAAAVGGTAGGAAGKKVSDGLTAVFGKIDERTKAAAKQAPPKEDAAKVKAVTQDPASAAATRLASADPGPAPKPAGGSAPKAAIKPPTKPATKPAAKAATVPPAPPETEFPPSVTRTSRRAVADSVPEPPPIQRAAASKPAPPPAPKPELQMAPILPPPPPPREATTEDLKDITLGTIREEVLKLGPPASRITMFDDGHLLEIYSYMNRNTTFGVVRLSDGAVSRVELR